MSYSNVRAAIVTAIEGLTPSSRVNDSFRYIDQPFSEEIARFRGFSVRLLVGPSQVGQVINGTDWRWLSTVELFFFYPRFGSHAEMEQVISEDATQAQTTLLQKGNHHSDVEGITPQGEGYSSVNIDYDDTGNALVTVSLSIHHL